MLISTASGILGRCAVAVAMRCLTAARVLARSSIVILVAHRSASGRFLDSAKKLECRRGEQSSQHPHHTHLAHPA